MNLWLTRIRPNLAKRQAGIDLRDAVAMHRTVMRLFPDDLGDEPRRAAGALFRIDDDASGPHILVQSTMKPDCDALAAGYGTVEAKDLSPMLQALRPGRRVHYRIAANAVRRTSRTPRPGREPGKIITLTGAAAEEWWRARAEAAGLQVETADSQPADTASGPCKSTGNRIKYQRYWFTGTAVITDADALLHRLTEGYGRGRSYGCGLLTLAPAR